MECVTRERDRAGEAIVDIEHVVAAGDGAGGIARQVKRQASGSFSVQAGDARNDLSRRQVQTEDSRERLLRFPTVTARIEHAGAVDVARPDLAAGREPAVGRERTRE